MVDPHESGVLDTCTYIDLGLLAPADLPAIPELTAITIAELHQRVAMAKDAAQRASRTELLVALTIEANRDPKPRRLDLMIAAIASSRGLPLYTRNGKDFAGLGEMVKIVEV